MPVIIEKIWIGGLSLLVIAAICVFLYRQYKKHKALLQNPILQNLNSNGSVILLLGGALICMALAVSDFKGRTMESITADHQLNIVYALDVSNSMLCMDIPPDRLSRAKVLLERIHEQLPVGKTGCVVFAGDAYILCPLTTDIAAVSMFIENSDPGMVTHQGTNLGAAIQTAVRVFREQSSGTNVLVCITDGEDLEGNANAAITSLKEQEIHPVFITIGTDEGGAIPGTDSEPVKLDPEGKPIITKPNRAQMHDLAKQCHGVVFDITGAENRIPEITNTIQQWNSPSLNMASQKEKIRYSKPLYPWFLFPAFLLTLIAYTWPFWRNTITNRRKKITIGKWKFIILGIFFYHSAISQDYHALRKGDRSYDAKDWQAAEQQYQQVVKEKDLKVALYNRGNAAYQQGKYPLADSCYQQASEFPDERLKNEILFNQGNAQYMQKQYDKSIASYKEVLRRQPQHVDAKNNLALAYQQLKEQQKQEQSQKEQSKSEPPPPKDQKKDQQQSQDQNQLKPQDPKNQPKYSEQEKKRLLDMMKEQEKQTRNKMNQQQKGNPQPSGRTKDW